MYKIMYIIALSGFTTAVSAAAWGDLTVTSKSSETVDVYCMGSKISKDDRSNPIMAIPSQHQGVISLTGKFPNAPTVGCNIVDHHSNVLFGNFEFSVDSSESNISVASATFLVCTNYFPTKNSAPSIEININCTPNTAQKLPLQ